MFSTSVIQGLGTGTIEKGGRRGERSRTQVAHKDFMPLLKISAAHFDDNLSAFKEYSQEPTTLMTKYM